MKIVKDHKEIAKAIKENVIFIRCLGALKMTKIPKAIFIINEVIAIILVIFNMSVYF